MAGQLSDSGDRFKIDSSEAAQYRPNLSPDATEPDEKDVSGDHPYALVIADLDTLDEFMRVGKAGMGITGIVRVALSEAAREQVQKRNEARIAYEISRRGLPESTTLPQLNEIIDAEHAAMRAQDLLRIKELVAKTVLESDQT